MPLKRDSKTVKEMDAKGTNPNVRGGRAYRNNKPYKQKTAYGKMQEDNRREERVRKRNQKHGQKKTAKAWGKVCGAKKRKGGKCTLAAGWGTPHPGIGACKLHGGSTPQHTAAAAKVEANKFLGTPMETNPYEAIMTCIRVRAGEVHWLSERMAEIDKTKWIEDSLIGQQFHIFARERAAAMDALVRYSHIAISMGIAERYVRLAETYGRMIGDLLRAVLSDPELGLNKTQIAISQGVVRRHLVALEGTTFDQTPTPGGQVNPDLKQITAGAKKKKKDGSRGKKKDKVSVST
jgi:hypothetical protein